MFYSLKKNWSRILVVLAILISVVSHFLLLKYVCYIDLLAFYIFLLSILIDEFLKNQKRKIEWDLGSFVRYSAFFVMLPVITIIITVLYLSKITNIYLSYFYVISVFVLLYIWRINNNNAYFSFPLSIIFSIGTRSIAYYLVLPYFIQIRNLKVKNEDRYLIGSFFLIFYVAIIYAFINTQLSSILKSFVAFVVVTLVSLLLNKSVWDLIKRDVDIVFSGIISLLFLVMKNDWISLGLVGASIVVYLLLKWDERAPVGYAILYLILAAAVLAKGAENFANDLAIVTYWNLCIGVITALIRTLREKNVEENNQPS